MPPAGRTVRFSVTPGLLLQHLLHLDGELAGAEVHQTPAGPVLVLHVEHPAAPAGADEVAPTYTRTACQGQGVCPGQVHLSGLDWRRGGHAVAPAHPDGLVTVPGTPAGAG